HELRPAPRLAKLGVITTLSGHRAQVERAALVQQLGFLCWPHLKVLHPVPHKRPVLGMQGSDIVRAAAQDVKSALQSCPRRGWESGPANACLAEYAAQFVRTWIEHSLVRQTHQ